MSLSIAELKGALRREIRWELDRITPEARQTFSTKAVVLLGGQEIWRQAKGILFYAPTRTELDLMPLLEASLSSGSKVALPRYDETRGVYSPAQVLNPSTDLQSARFGILEPKPACPPLPWNQLDLALVPGVAFSHDGGRLGRGNGFYDRLLSCFSGSACGVGFDFQVVDVLPVEPHDRRLDYLLTPTRWTQCKPRAVLE